MVQLLKIRWLNLIGKFHNKKAVVITLSSVVVVLSAAVVFSILQITKAPAETPLTGGANTILTKVEKYTGMTGTDDFANAFYKPKGMALDKNGILIIADTMSDRIRVMNKAKPKIIGKGGQNGVSYENSGTLVDGTLEKSRFSKPSDVAVFDGNIYVCDSGNNAVRIISDKYVVTLAGGKKGYKNGKEGNAEFNNPQSVVISKDGTVYVADTMNHCIRAVDKKGKVTLFAGTPEKSGFKDGKLQGEAQFYEPCGLSFGNDGSLYVADSANHAIRKIAEGKVTTIAGKPGNVNDLTGYPEGGYTEVDVASARFNFPGDVSVTDSGDIYVADTMNHSIRLITNGKVRTILGGGVPGKQYYSAENIKLTRPQGVYVDSEGTVLYISDTYDDTVLKIPLTQSVMSGKRSRDSLLRDTGIAVDTAYAYSGDMRLFADNVAIKNSGYAYNTSENIYVPIIPVLQSLGAEVVSNEKSIETITVTIGAQTSTLVADTDYFLHNGTAVTTAEIMMKLFPYRFEWYPEYNTAIFISGDGYE